MRTTLLIAFLALAGCASDKPEDNSRIGPVTGEFANRECYCRWYNNFREGDFNNNVTLFCNDPTFEQFDFHLTFAESQLTRRNERMNIPAELAIEGGALSSGEAGRGIVELAGRSIKDARGGHFSFFFRPFFVHELRMEKQRLCDFFDQDECYDFEASTMKDTAFWCEDSHASATGSDTK